jgi:hypothetical protein
MRLLEARRKVAAVLRRRDDCIAAVVSHGVLASLCFFCSQLMQQSSSNRLERVFLYVGYSNMIGKTQGLWHLLLPMTPRCAAIKGCVREGRISSYRRQFSSNQQHNGVGEGDGRGLQCQIVVGRLWFVSQNGRWPWSNVHFRVFTID